MKILFLNVYFFPEVVSFTHLEQDLIKGFIGAGHEISVICPIPTRNVSAQTAKKYRSVKSEELYDGHVHVKRFWAPQEGKNPIIRAFRYLWCNLREYQIGRKYKDIDLIFTVSTPPTQGLLAGKLNKKLKCPFVYSLQDVFPDSLVTTGITHEGSLMWKIGRKIEDKTYAKSSKVIVISEAIVRNLQKKGIDEQKLELIPNWIDTMAVNPVAKEDNKLFSEFGIDPNKFIVMYAGNFGAAQGANVVVKVAELLKDNNNIQFVVFGGGSEFEAAQKEVVEKQLTNIMMNPLLPQDRVSEVYSLGNVVLITCKPGVGSSGMPSKTWSIMACNTPIIASFDTDSELASIINEAGAGVCIEPGNAEKLADTILNAYTSGFIKSYGRKYVKMFASKEVCVNKYIKVISNCAD